MNYSCAWFGAARHCKTMQKLPAKYLEKALRTSKLEFASRVQATSIRALQSQYQLIQDRLVTVHENLKYKAQENDAYLENDLYDVKNQMLQLEGDLDVMARYLQFS